MLLLRPTGADYLRCDAHVQYVCCAWVLDNDRYLTRPSAFWDRFWGFCENATAEANWR